MSGRSEPTVVYVHGNGNKVSSDDLKSKWDRALFEQDMGDTTRMAYFADLRYPVPLEFWEQDPEVASASSLESFEATEDWTEEDFVADLLAGVDEGESSPLAPWASVLAEQTVELADREPINGEVADPETLEVLGILPRAARVRVFRGLVKVVFKDVHAYLFGGFGDQMRARVAGALDGLTGPVVVIGHSLGSIVAYDTLRDARLGDLDVRLFATVGSPLGIREVQDLIVRPLQVPGSVASWLNVSDPLDLVALDKSLEGEYEPSSRVTDYSVVNDTPNHHGITGYLRHDQEVRDHVKSGLEGGD